MSTRRPSIALAAVLAGGLALSACATTPMGGAAGPAVFSADDFAWSTRAGQASIEGRVAFAQDGKTFHCVGNVGLIPDTRYTRARIERLYGASDRAAVPAAVVRARSAGEQGADYRSYERANACAGDAFRFSGLPDGSWFLIAPVKGGDEIMVLMRRVQTRGGRAVTVTLGG
ncbi:hypothetical protein D8I30_03555 [Brevundimonas naejangsanensis]|uniref:Lipoprotein n=1 Tax=Brevundimonas naejangsanensis TaxID=588932 RepID=A0A494RKH2_9CAUL|nr:hypothetical protein [Brevundimonas naejangsanensis]AYG94364.1 hypothetical protein D8I30_03555 [Brevundimonas naejangsanensis]